MADKQAEIDELAKKIKFYQDDYYSGGQAISDAEFDKMWDRLTALDPENPILQKVGSDVQDDSDDLEGLDGFAKAKHVIPMGSQKKAANPEEFETWASTHRYPEYLVQHKLDGCVSGDTIVETELGPRAIKDVVQGQDLEVLSFNEDEQKAEMRPILAKQEKESDKAWYKVTLKTGKVLKITENDRLRVENGAYRQVADLRAGDRVLAR